MANQIKPICGQTYSEMMMTGFRNDWGDAVAVCNRAALPLICLCARIHSYMSPDLSEIKVL